MNVDLLTALRALSAPGAVLECSEFPEFGFLEPLCTVEGSRSYTSIGYPTLELLRELGYVYSGPSMQHAWQTAYAISAQGRAALAAAERNAVPLTTQEDTRHE